MRVLTATVRFTVPIPANTDLVAALCQHTGELVSYEEELYKLICPALKDRGIIMAIADPQESIWELRTGYLDGSYFWYAALIVLQKMGGEQVGFDGNNIPGMPAPAWAYKPWQLAKWQYRWRKWRKTIWLTLKEARRLGIVK